MGIEGTQLVDATETEMIWTPQKVRRTLERYHELRATCDGVRAIRYHDEPRHHGGDQWATSDKLVSIDLALAWLSQLGNDPQAYEVICLRYIDGFSTATIAEEIGMPQGGRPTDRRGESIRTVHRAIEDGISMMAWRLGYQRRQE